MWFKLCNDSTDDFILKLIVVMFLPLIIVAGIGDYWKSAQEHELAIEAVKAGLVQQQDVNGNKIWVKPKE